LARARQRGGGGRTDRGGRDPTRMVSCVLPVRLLFPSPLCWLNLEIVNGMAHELLQTIPPSGHFLFIAKIEIIHEIRDFFIIIIILTDSFY
jgi:hypothetical protein